MTDRSLYLPVLLGTVRKGRRSLHPAALMRDEIAKRPGVTTDLIDVAELGLPVDDAGEQIKNPGFSEQMNRADGVVVVASEYNHGYPGMLKHALDTNLKEYVHKAVGVVGVSAGVFGGARAIENLLPVLRELGLVTIFWDVNFSSVYSRFDDAGGLVDESFLPRVAKFLDELIWMATTLRHGREAVPLPVAGAA